MKFHKLLILLVLQIFIGLCLVSTAHSAKVSLSSKFYSDSGLKNYKKGEIAAAIKDFSKALISDPSNRVAKEHLDKIGVDDGLYLKSARFDPSIEIAKLQQERQIIQNRMSDLKQDNSEQRARCDDLQAANDELCRDVDAKERELKLSQIKLGLVADTLEKRATQDFKKIQHYKKVALVNGEKNETFDRVNQQHKGTIQDKEQSIAQRDEKIEILKDRLALVKRSSAHEIYKYEDRFLAQEAEHKDTVLGLKKRINDLESSNAKVRSKSLTHIKSLKQDLAQRAREIDETNTKLAYATSSVDQIKTEKMFEVKGLKTTIDAKIEMIKKKDTDIASLKEQLVSAKKQIGLLEEKRGSGSRDEIALLNKKMDSIQDQLKNKSMTLQAKESDISVLRERLSDAKERLDLVQEIIEEKESEIKDLESKIIEIRNQCEN